VEGLIIEYQDPLFGLILFVGFIFIIALLTYLWSLYATKEQSNHIESFTQRFYINTENQGLDPLLFNPQTPKESLLLLAQTYFTSGAYEEVIKITLELLKGQKESLERRDLLMLLARAYFKAGLYKRSEIALVELLRYHTREPAALKYLLLIYERLQRYDDAIDILDSLEEMQEEVALERIYFKFLKTAHAPKLTLEEKSTKLLALRQHPTLLRPIFGYLLRHNPAITWEHLDGEVALQLIDVLYRLPKEQLRQVAPKDAKLHALLCALGAIDEEAQPTGNFTIDTVNALTPSYKARINIAFIYSCDNCSSVTPLENHRCPSCMQALSMRLRTTLAPKDKHEAYYAF